MSRLKVEESTGYTKTQKKAKSVLDNPRRISKLIETSKKKISNLDLGEKEFKGILGTIKTFIRMLRAFRNGTYTDIPWLTVLTVVGALIYFITPIDLLPDFIPVTGYVDDFSLILTVYNRFKGDIIAFQAWENSRE